MAEYPKDEETPREEVDWYAIQANAVLGKEFTNEDFTSSLLYSHNYEKPGSVFE